MMSRPVAEQVARTWASILEERHPEYGRIEVRVVEPRRGDTSAGTRPRLENEAA